MKDLPSELVLYIANLPSPGTPNFHVAVFPEASLKLAAAE